MTACTRKIELLAPAGTCETGIAAITCGADAVYIGPERFGARSSAGNSLFDIERLCRYAHRYWARVYATVNTILRDDELQEAAHLIQKLYDVGVDGLIVQDMGLLELDLPPLQLIASTQTHNNSPEKVAFLEGVGFSRVILARELSLEEIRRIRAATRVELECFVHGALCVCYSGQCSMSYAIGGRSANRGECAQPCRRPYRLEDGAGNLVAGPSHFLSLKDLNLSGHLQDLIDIGVSAFKIEGRLKDRAYVINTTSFYRKKLDALLEGSPVGKSSSGKSVFFFSPDPVKTFNRGFTTYFLINRPSGLASLSSPTWTGEYIGKVSSVQPTSFTLAVPHDLHSGDGISFFGKHGQLKGSVVNRVDGKTVFPEKIEGIFPGTVVYRNHDHRFMQNLSRRFAERRIAVRMEFEETPSGFLLRAIDEDGLEVTCGYACEKKSAEKKEQALATISRQLQKLGETCFYCTDVSIKTESVYFIPVAILNSLRRSVVKLLEEKREKMRPVVRGGALRTTIPYPQKELFYTDNVLNKKAALFYRRHGVVKIEPAAESGLSMKGRRVMRTKYCIRYELGWCYKKTKGPVPSDPLYLVDTSERRFRLLFDCRKCCMELFME